MNKMAEIVLGNDPRTIVTIPNCNKFVLLNDCNDCYRQQTSNDLFRRVV
jgi:hypothetical protein